MPDGIVLPSRAMFDQYDLDTLLMMDKFGFLQFNLEQPFVLNSGKRTVVYVGGREDLTDNRELLWRLGRKLAVKIAAQSRPEDRQICLLGVPIAGNTLAHEIATASFVENHLVNGTNICHRIIRQYPKLRGDGREEWITGPPAANHSYWLTDNALTTAGSLLYAKDNIANNGYSEIAGCVFAVNRQQGGIERLRNLNLNRIVLGYHLLDLVYVLCNLRKWPQEVLIKFQEELSNSEQT